MCKNLAKIRLDFIYVYCSNAYLTNGSNIYVYLLVSLEIKQIFFFLFFAGFLLEGVTPTAPPDVPPRNPTMSRMNNARLIAGGVANNPNDLGVDFEPSCLVRTPSGNVYIPSGNLSE